VLRTYVTPCEILRPGAAHIRYFLSDERISSTSNTMTQRQWVMSWLLGEDVGDFPRVGQRWSGLATLVSYAIVTVMLASVTALLFAVFKDAAKALFGGQPAWNILTWSGFASAVSATFAIAISGIAMAGILRWAYESRLNYRLAKFDGDKFADKKVVAENLLIWHAIAGWLFFALGSIAIIPVLLEKLGFLPDVTVHWPAGSPSPSWGWLTSLHGLGDILWYLLHCFRSLIPASVRTGCLPVVAMIVMLLAALTQICINVRWRRGKVSCKWDRMAARSARASSPDVDEFGQLKGGE
jgi:hypothetical protein